LEVGFQVKMRDSNVECIQFWYTSVVTITIKTKTVRVAKFQHVEV